MRTAQNQIVSFTYTETSLGLLFVGEVLLLFFLSITVYENNVLFYSIKFCDMNLSLLSWQRICEAGFHVDFE